MQKALVLALDALFAQKLVCEVTGDSLGVKLVFSHHRGVADEMSRRRAQRVIAFGSVSVNEAAREQPGILFNVSDLLERDFRSYGHRLKRVKERALPADGIHKLVPNGTQPVRQMSQRLIVSRFADRREVLQRVCRPVDCKGAARAVENLAARREDGDCLYLVSQRLGQIPAVLNYLKVGELNREQGDKRSQRQR